MFENFHFGAQSQPQYDCEVSTSPTDTRFPSLEPIPQHSYPFPDSGIEYLAHTLENQSLSGDNRLDGCAIWAKTAAHSLETDEDEMSYWTSRSRRSTYVAPLSDYPSRSSSSSRRTQRQLHVQMQCSANHIRDINALIEDMISSSSQCQLSSPSSRHIASNEAMGPTEQAGVMVATTEPTLDFTSSKSDEGFQEEGEEWDEMSMRRASAPSGIRKYDSTKFNRMPDTIWVNGKMKVKCKLRMRKRASKIAKE